MLVLTGTGRIFSSGYHLGDLQDRASRAAAAGARARQRSFEDMVNKLEKLARADDLPAERRRLWRRDRSGAWPAISASATANAQMFMPAARLGLHYYESGMVRYVTRLGINAAKLLFLTARKIQADGNVPDRLSHHAVRGRASSTRPSTNW